MLLIGSQRPTYEWSAPYQSSSGPDAVAIARANRLLLDEWQDHALDVALAETGQFTFDGKPVWLNNEVGLICARQNGKGGIIEARELAGIFIFDEVLILHSAHQQRTSNDMFVRMKAIIQSNPDLDKRVTAISHSKGEEGFTFRIPHDAKASRCHICQMRDQDAHEAKLRYMARTGGAGRGFTKSNLIIIDEAMILDDPPVAALIPTMATQPTWQVWYVGSQGDRRLPTSSRVLGRIRRRGHRQEQGLALLEWSAHLRHDKTCPRDERGVPLDALDVRGDPRTWAKTNPAMNIVRRDGTIGIPEAFLRKMIIGGGMATWDADREFLGVGDYPEDEGWNLVSESTWSALEDVTSRRGNTFCVGVEVAADHSCAAVCIASLRDDGFWHWEVLKVDVGTAWVAPYCRALLGKRPTLFVCDARSPIAADVKEAVGVKRFHSPTTVEYPAWCAKVLQLVVETHGARHIGQLPLTDAFKFVQKKDYGNGVFVWDRNDTTGDVSPLIAVTLAVGGVLLKGRARSRKPLVAAAGGVRG